MAAISSTRLLDRIIPGGTEKWLRQARKQGESYRQIARRLEIEHGHRVTHQTILNWCHHYGIHGPSI